MNPRFTHHEIKATNSALKRRITGNRTSRTPLKKWQLKHQRNRAHAGNVSRIRRAGKDRGRGQVDGLTQDVERVCNAETEGTLSRLRDAAISTHE